MEKNYIMEVNGYQQPITNILQNIFFCGQHKKKFRYIKFFGGEWTIHIWINVYL